MQIGPKIRVGGSVGHIGQNVKTAIGKGYTDAGHAVGDAADNKWVKGAVAAGLMATGAGAPLGAAVMGGMGIAGGAMKRGGGLHDALTDGAKGAVIGGVAGGVGSGLHAMNAAGQAAGVGRGAMLKAGAQELGGSLMHGAGAIGSRVGMALVPGARVASSMLGGGGGGGGGSSLMDKLLMAGSVAAAAADRHKQEQLMDEAKGYATQSYDARAPLRARALAALNDPASAANRPGDLSQIFSNPGSVYDKIGQKVPVQPLQY